MTRKQQEHESKVVKEFLESKATINNLSTVNNKMANEIQVLKSSFENISRDYNQMRNILDIKQKDWIKVESNKPKAETSVFSNQTNYATVVSNSLETLSDEHTSNETSVNQDNSENETLPCENKSVLPQISNNKNAHNPKEPSEKKRSNVHQDNPVPPAQAPVIGDSMIKNIQEDKLAYAANVMTTCRCYRGAKIKDIHQNLLKDCSQQRSEKMHSIIIHAGTNNLTNNDLDTTAKEIENLIVDAKLKAKNFAVSSVITRYDNRVPHSRVTKFNLVHECCKKHNISFIDNNNIDRSMLNRSNLHLNNNGNKALGRSLCMYVCM